MNLLVDIGNSRLKWTIEHKGSIGVIESSDYRRPEFLDELRQRWQTIGFPNKLGIASVSAKSVSKAITALGVELWPGIEITLPQSAKQAFGVRNAYEHPEKLGIDRWLALIAARRNYPGAVCIVDCGTAITIDALDADGKHLGGLICPGLIAMKKALAADTADLNFNSDPYNAGLATETNAAIANGVLTAALGLVEHTKQFYATETRLILTGGDAEIIAGSLMPPPIIDKELVLKGLAILCSGEWLV